MTKLYAGLFLFATLMFAGLYTYTVVEQHSTVIRIFASTGLCICLILFVLCIVIIQDQRKVK